MPTASSTSSFDTPRLSLADYRQMSEELIKSVCSQIGLLAQRDISESVHAYCTTLKFGHFNPQLCLAAQVVKDNSPTLHVYCAQGTRDCLAAWRVYQPNRVHHDLSLHAEEILTNTELLVDDNLLPAGVPSAPGCNLLLVSILTVVRTNFIRLLNP